MSSEKAIPIEILVLCSGRGGAEGLGTIGAGANAAKMIVAVDAGGVTVGECKLDGIVADRGSFLRARFGREHRQRGGGSRARTGKSALSYPLIIARGARALIAKIGEIVVTRMTVRPRDVDTGATGYVNLYAGRFFAEINGNGHEISSQSTVNSLQSRKAPAKVRGRS
jgi:hypothetical protein